MFFSVLLRYLIFICIVNVSVLGVLGYFMYANWNTRHVWMYDRKLVTAVVVGLGLLGFGEG